MAVFKLQMHFEATKCPVIVNFTTTMAIKTKLNWTNTSPNPKLEAQTNLYKSWNWNLKLSFLHVRKNWDRKGGAIKKQDWNNSRTLTDSFWFRFRLRTVWTVAVVGTFVLGFDFFRCWYSCVLLSSLKWELLNVTFRFSLLYNNKHSYDSTQSGVS